MFDPHINRIPIDGRIDYVNYNPGKFFQAFTDKASSDNENVEIGLVHRSGKFVFKIIAGILARRIEYSLQDNQEVTAGDVFGMIHFGSRAEFFLPDNVEVQVKPGRPGQGGRVGYRESKGAIMPVGNIRGIFPGTFTHGQRRLRVSGPAFGIRG